MPQKSLLSILSLLFLIVFLAGCARLFGWDIHAPGILSENFSRQVKPLGSRIALYLTPEILTYQSQNRGSRWADPQTYHIGEAFSPMLVESLQQGFEEFILMETMPTPEIMSRYQIPYLAGIRIKEFKNRVNWRGQAVSLIVETMVYDSQLKKIAQFESRGTSDARKVFAKRGGPEVNLNAAIEENVLAIVQYLQDFVRNR